MSNFIDMTGWRMSEHGQPNSILTVVKRDTEFDKIRTTEPIRWICKCDCGTIKSISGAELRRKTKPTLSCGCLTKERNKHFGDFTARDLTNKKIGMLTPLYIVGTNKYHYNIWHCKCDCGNECDVLSRELLSGNTKSCGCRKSTQPENDIETLLIQYNIKYIKEYIFDDLRDKYPLRFDFAIFNNDRLVCLIEYQGQQHTKKNNAWYSEELKKHDQMKKEYCYNKRLDFFEIQYYNNIKDKLIEILMKEGVLSSDQITEL